jgi:hypothetical protein
MLCVRNATFSPITTGKNYTCDVPDATVAGLLGNTVQFSCSTNPPPTANITLTGEIDIGAFYWKSVGGGGQCSIG